MWKQTVGMENKQRNICCYVLIITAEFGLCFMCCGTRNQVHIFRKLFRGNNEIISKLLKERFSSNYLHYVISIMMRNLVIIII